ncbi:MAG: pseudouridine synthase [Candidatus Methanomethylophilaceae archaeon]|nr:pseudouridine synthase [Candidatus Methanomethylophilaceae archaeon]
MSEGVRLNKFISEAGVASRRAADRMVEDGRVTINGRRAVLGDRIMDGDKVAVDGKLISKVEEDIILAFHKPRGITCTSNLDDPDNIIDFIGYPKRIYSIGRLDKDSEGLILMTNNGELANSIMRSRGEHEKEYIVTVNRSITPEFIKGMSNGVPILDGKITKRCFVEQLTDREFRIILKQGLNRQIRRMCEHFGYDVTRLVRIRVMNIRLGKLKEGRYRDLSKDERNELFLELGL